MTSNSNELFASSKQAWNRVGVQVMSNNLYQASILQCTVAFRYKTHVCFSRKNTSDFHDIVNVPGNDRPGPGRGNEKILPGVGAENT